jgi:putative membrane protein
MRRTLAFAALAAIGLGAASALVAVAQDKDVPKKDQPAKDKDVVKDKEPPGKSGTDADFVMKAFESDLAEINLGNLAAGLASNPEVKQFGRRMVDDHKKSSTELLAIINKRGYKVPGKMTPEHQSLWDQLTKTLGAKFDQAYIQGIVKDHEAAVNLFKQEADQGKDEEVKKFAAKTLPVIEEHLKLAHKLAVQLSTKLQPDTDKGAVDKSKGPADKGVPEKDKGIPAKDAKDKVERDKDK